MANNKLNILLEIFFSFLDGIKKPFLFTVIPLLSLSILNWIGISGIYSFILSLILGIIIWTSYYIKKIISWIKINKKKFLSIFVAVSMATAGMVVVTNLDLEPNIPGDTDYYISNDGADSNSGTSPEFPWESISKLNQELNSGGCIVDGDNINFRRGDIFDVTSQIILRTKTGTKTDPMVWGAYGTGADPIIRTNSASSGGILTFVNSNEGYITWQNLHFLTTNSGAGKAIDLDKTYHIFNLTVRDCIFESSSPTGYCRLLFRYATNVTVENCIGKNGSIDIYGRGTTHTIIQNCEIYSRTSNGPDLIAIHDDDYYDTRGNGPYHYLYNVTCHDTPTNCFDIVPAQYNSQNVRGEWIYLKNCTGYNSGQSPIVIGHKARNVTVEDCYFRSTGTGNNALYFTDNQNSIIRNSVFIAPTDVIGLDPQPQYYWGWGTVNASIYNTIFIDTSPTGGDFIFQVGQGSYGSPQPENGLAGIRFRNNILMSLTSSTPTYFIQYPNQAGVWNLANTESNYSHNMYWRGDGNFNSDRFNLIDVGTFNLSEWNAQSEVFNDLGDEPELSDKSGTTFPDDFKLISTSPCIDAGDWLTYAVGSGSGTTITVEHSNWFFPGFTVRDTVISGDNIFVGNYKNLVINSVNYDTNTITVNRSISWSEGDEVSLSNYQGSAPDIGAFEYAFSNSAPTVSNERIWDSASSTQKDLSISEGAFTVPTSFNVTISDADGDSMDVYSYTNASGSWKEVGSSLSQSNGTITFTNTSWVDTVGETYYISFNISDGTDWTNETFSFVTGYTTTIRYGGEDYFIWMGGSTTASVVDNSITNFDGTTEYIAIWNNDTWDDTNALWNLWYGDWDGTDWTINTFDVIKIYLTGSGTQDISMEPSDSTDYSTSRSVTIKDITINKGYNFTGYTHSDLSTISDAADKTNLTTGELIAVWDDSSYVWIPWIIGFGPTDASVSQYDIYMTLVDGTRYFQIG